MPYYHPTRSMNCFAIVSAVFEVFTRKRFQLGQTGPFIDRLSSHERLNHNIVLYVYKIIYRTVYEKNSALSGRVEQVCFSSLYIHQNQTLERSTY